MNGRLEKYGNFLLPVDDIVYVEYKTKNSKSGYPMTGTYIYVRTGNGGVLSQIYISEDNELDKFSKWLRKFSPVNSIFEYSPQDQPFNWDGIPKAILCECPKPVEFPKEWTYTNTRTTTTSDGREHTVKMDGLTSKSENI